MSKNQKYVDGSFSVTPVLSGLTLVPPTDFSSDDNQQHTFWDYTFSESTTKQYTITYQTKAIDSGMTPDGKVYVPVYPQGQEITVTEDGAKSSITFENQFSEWPDGFYRIANLNVTKKLLGADGNALESDGVFYAGIFEDKECTILSTRTEKNILTLDLAGGSTVSESTQAVVMPGESFNLYVAETDAEGNPVADMESFKYEVTVEDGNVYFDENNLNAKVTITNQEQPEATPTVTPEETPTPTPGSSTGVKTGDDTPIGFYMAMLFVAALAIEETTRRRRKKEQD